MKNVMQLPLKLKFTKRTATAAIILLLILSISITLAAQLTAEAALPARRLMRIGLNFGNTAVPAANLVNSGGFLLGYYDTAHNFVPVTETDRTRISVMVDRRLQWTGSAYTLIGGDGLGVPAPGSVFVGCNHVRVTSGESSMAAAVAALGGNAAGFVRFHAGLGAPFIPLLGFGFSSQDEAAGHGSVIDSGGTATVTVVETGTNTILFEFDPGGTDFLFGAEPRNPDITITYNNREYLGGFRFQRHAPTLLTVVNMVHLESYIKGVVPHEMSNSWPLEALKAQAICARTYALAQLNKHGSSGFDLCNTADCQVYYGYTASYTNSHNAVDQTAGMVVTYNGALISTFYCSSHGGGSENNENVWAGTALPYLRGVLDNYEYDISTTVSQYFWTFTISQADITARVRNAGYTGASTIATIYVSEYSPTGNVVSVVATDSNGVNYTFSRRGGLQSLFGSIRSQRFNIGASVWAPNGSVFVNNSPYPMNLGRYSLASFANNSVAVTSVPGPLKAITGSGQIVTVTGSGNTISAGTPTGPVNGNFVLTGSGWGHNVGMSQWGAYSMARYHGKTAAEIIMHYYTGVAITQS